MPVGGHEEQASRRPVVDVADLPAAQQFQTGRVVSTTVVWLTLRTSRKPWLDSPYYTTGKGNGMIRPGSTTNSSGSQTSGRKVERA